MISASRVGNSRPCHTPPKPLGFRVLDSCSGFRDKGLGFMDSHFSNLGVIL